MKSKTLSSIAKKKKKYQQKFWEKALYFYTNAITKSIEK